MGTSKLAGFTIIETMLFLAISGMLVVSMLIGVGASVNVQRYRDAGESFKSLIQEQYADLNSVQNSRDDNWSCGSDAIPVNGGSGTQIRGQSSCVLIGKYLQVKNGDISVFRVVGYKISSGTYLNDDIASLKNNYLLNVVQDTVDISTLEWGTRISYPVVRDGVANPYPTPRSLGILFVRSPDSGQIYTFSNNDGDVPAPADITPLTFANMLVGGNTIPGQGAQLICIDTNGLFVSNDRAVYLSAFASGASAVEIRSNDYMTSIGQAAKC